MVPSDTVSLRITLRYKDLDEFVARYAENVSSAGLFLRTRSPKNTGTKIRFELLLADGARALRGEGVVVTVRNDDKPGMALRFNVLDAESQAVIDRIVATHGHGPLAPTPLSTNFGPATAPKPSWKSSAPSGWGSAPKKAAGGSVLPQRLPRLGGAENRTPLPRGRSALPRPWAQDAEPSRDLPSENEALTQRIDLDAHKSPVGEAKVSTNEFENSTDTRAPSRPVVQSVTVTVSPPTLVVPDFAANPFEDVPTWTPERLPDPAAEPAPEPPPEPPAPEPTEPTSELPTPSAAPEFASDPVADGFSAVDLVNALDSIAVGPPAPVASELDPWADLAQVDAPPSPQNPFNEVTQVGRPPDPLAAALNVELLPPPNFDDPFVEATHVSLSEPEPEAATILEPAPEPAPIPEPEPQAVLAPEPEPEAALAPEPEAVLAPEPVAEPEPVKPSLPPFGDGVWSELTIPIATELPVSVIQPASDLEATNSDADLPSLQDVAQTVISVASSLVEAPNDLPAEDFELSSLSDWGAALTGAEAAEPLPAPLAAVTAPKVSIWEAIAQADEPASKNEPESALDQLLAQASAEANALDAALQEPGSGELENLLASPAVAGFEAPATSESEPEPLGAVEFAPTLAAMADSLPSVEADPLPSVEVEAVDDDGPETRVLANPIDDLEALQDVASATSWSQAERAQPPASISVRHFDVPEPEVEALPTQIIRTPASEPLTSVMTAPLAAAVVLVPSESTGDTLAAPLLAAEHAPIESTAETSVAPMAATDTEATLEPPPRIEIEPFAVDEPTLARAQAALENEALAVIPPRLNFDAETEIVGTSSAPAPAVERTRMFSTAITVRGVEGPAPEPPEERPLPRYRPVSERRAEPPAKMLEKARAAAFSEEATEVPPERVAEPEPKRTQLRAEPRPERRSSTISNEPVIVGIDLGGHWVRIGLFEQGELALVRAGGAVVMPALVAARGDGSLVVGQKAYALRMDDPSRVVSPRQVLAAVADDGVRADALPGRTLVDNGSTVRLRLGPRDFDVTELLVALFMQVRQALADHLEGARFRAVVAIPPILSKRAQTLLLASLTDAGIDVLQLVPEPEAMLRAYNLEEQPIDSVLLVDVGATHLGVAVARRGRSLAVASTQWNEKLSAASLDNAVADQILAELAQSAGEDHRNSPTARLRLTEALEHARQDIRRSATVELRVTLPAPGGASGVVLERSLKLPRSRIYQATESVVMSITEQAHDVLEHAGVDPRTVGAVVLSGSGGSYPPLAQSLARLTQREVLVGVPPPHVMALGLVRTGQALARAENASRPDALVASVGMELTGGRFRPLVTAGTRLPARLERTYPTTRDGQTELELKLFQGDAEFVRSCVPLGTLVLQGIPKAMRGEVSVTLELALEADGVLTVTLSELKSGANERLVVATAQTTPERKKALVARAPLPKPAPEPQKDKGFFSRLFGRK